MVLVDGHFHSAHANERNAEISASVARQDFTKRRVEPIPHVVVVPNNPSLFAESNNTDLDSVLSQVNAASKTAWNHDKEYDEIVHAALNSNPRGHNSALEDLHRHSTIGAQLHDHATRLIDQALQHPDLNTPDYDDHSHAVLSSLENLYSDHEDRAGEHHHNVSEIESNSDSDGNMHKPSGW